MKTIEVATPSKKYNVVVAPGILERAGKLAAEVVSPAKAVVVSDSNVAPLYLERLVASLVSAGFEPVSYVFPAGERSKTAETLISLLNFMAGAGLTRSDALFALGGGVVGDLGGLAAALYMRGIALLQIPTSLLAAVDSSVGGKTAVDLDAGKNLAGVFYQPDLVICDTETPATLPERELSNGYAEVVKYAFISDGSLLDRVGSREGGELEEIICRCVEIKRDIVSLDERDRGLRQLLNFGHTFGHAIEKRSGYTVSHGAAVASGMAIITRAAASLGMCEPDCPSILAAALKRAGLPSSVIFTEDELFPAVLSDKKRSSHSIILVIPRRVGLCELMSVELERARELLALGIR